MYHLLLAVRKECSSLTLKSATSKPDFENLQLAAGSRRVTHCRCSRSRARSLEISPRGEAGPVPHSMHACNKTISIYWLGLLVCCICKNARHLFLLALPAFGSRPIIYCSCLKSCTLAVDTHMSSIYYTLSKAVSITCLLPMAQTLSC